MRIVHTSDWHAGRVWKGVSRLDELSEVLDDLAGFIEDEEIDVLLHSGDIFDSGSPKPEAEKLVFEFFKRVGTGGCQSIFIAGNHDSPRRLDAWSTLAELVSVHSVTRPKSRAHGGLLDIALRSDERLRVAAIPFAAPRHFVTALDLVGDDETGYRKYDQAMRGLVKDLSAGFGSDSVNLIMAHTHLEGAVVSGSERMVHVGVDWASSAEAFPADADYVALGHIHKPQKVRASCAAEYAGSPLQLDFGEEGETKSFVFVEVKPRQDRAASASAVPRMERIPYSGGRTLKTVEAPIDLLERRAVTLARTSEEHWLRVRLPEHESDPSINQRVRRLIPNAVVVELKKTQATANYQSLGHERSSLPPAELYRRYHERTHGRAPDTSLLEAFDSLYESSRQSGQARQSKLDEDT